MTLIVHGMPGSSNVQSVLLTLAEKGVEYDLHEQPAAAYKRAPYITAVHPFGMVPALEHDDFTLYETQAIVRYVDDAFAGPRLAPQSPRPLARMNQIIGIAQEYLKGSVSGGSSINFYRAWQPKFGIEVDHAWIAALLPRARTALFALDRLHAEPYLTGDLSLADLMVAPILYVFRRTPEGAELLGAFPRLLGWLERCEARPTGRLMRMP
jgi:glutathione S-transferase